MLCSEANSISMRFTDRVHSTMGGYVFTGVCLFRWGAPVLGWGTPIWPGQMGSPPSGEVRMGYPPIWPGQYGVPPARDGVPPRDRRAVGVLDTPRSVCLLRSRRRTFLCCDILLKIKRLQSINYTKAAKRYLNLI